MCGASAQELGISERRACRSIGQPRSTQRKSAVVAPLFGIILRVYTYGIWAMRKFALPVAYICLLCVILNMVLFTMKNSDTRPLPFINIVVGITRIPTFELEVPARAASRARRPETVLSLPLSSSGAVRDYSSAPRTSQVAPT
jgi:hypothetical protein